MGGGLEKGGQVSKKREHISKQAYNPRNEMGGLVSKECGLVSKEWRIMEKGGLVSKEWRIMEKGGLVSRIMEKGGLVSKEWRLIEKSNLVFKDIVGLANISFPLL